jgi:trypsin
VSSWFIYRSFVTRNLKLTHFFSHRNVAEEDLPLYSIRAGSSDHRSGGITARISAVHRHPDYIPYPAKNDIAVLKLATPLPYNGTIQPAYLPEQYLKIKEFTWVLSSGWGLANYEGPGTTRIQSIFVPIISNKICTDVFGDDSYDMKSQLCTSEEPRASCQGDSGSALILSDMAVGIITYTADCPNIATPKAYTRVKFFVEWIESYL